MVEQQSVVNLFKQIAGNEFGFFSRLRTITDLIENNVPLVSCDDDYGQFVGRKNVRTLGSRGVYDPEDGELIGILKQSTILRFYPRYLNTLREKDEDADVLNTRIVSLITRPLPQLARDASPLDAIEIFLERDIDCLFIYEDGKPIGVVTPIEFVKTMAVYYQIYLQVKPLKRLRLMDLDELQLDEIFYRGAQTARDCAGHLPVLAGEEPVLAIIKAMHDTGSNIIGLTDSEKRINKVISLNDILIVLAPPKNYVEYCAGEDKLGDDKTVGPETIWDLVPWEDMCVSKDSVLREPAYQIAKTKTSLIEPTTRLQDVLTTLLESHEDQVLLVKDGKELQGVITIRQILRIFKTLLRIQKWES